MFYLPGARYRFGVPTFTALVIASRKIESKVTLKKQNKQTKTPNLFWLTKC